ncbi:MAG: ribbon-helix-helix protein, CopG family [Anaerolineales bacterium]
MGSNFVAKAQAVQISLTDAQNSQLDRMAKRYGVTKSAIIRVALQREFALEDQLTREYADLAHSEKQKNRGALQPLLF